MDDFLYEQSVNKKAAPFSLMLRLPKDDMFALGKTCKRAIEFARVAHVERKIKAFTPYLYNDTPLVDMQLRGGIITRTNSVTGGNNVFFDHQIKIAMEVAHTDIGIDFEERAVHKILVWDMGCGKTMAAIAIMSAVHALIPNASIEYKALIVVPKAMLLVWQDAVLQWTTFSGSDILCTNAQEDVTHSRLQAASVVIITPGLITTAFKTYYWKNPHHYQFPTGSGGVRYLAGYERISAPTAKQLKKGIREPPPVHPLFELSPTVMIMDECQLWTNASSWLCYCTRIITMKTKYVIAMSGTPFQNKPEEAAGLFKTMAVKHSYLWLSSSWMKAQSKNALRSDTVFFAHKVYVSRVTSEILNLPEKRSIRIDFDPQVGNDADAVITPLAAPAAAPTPVRTLAVKAFNKAAQEARSVCFHQRTGVNRQRLMGRLIRAVGTMEQGYMDATLCIRGAKQYGGTNPHNEIDDEAYSMMYPSKQVQLLYRLIRDRQRHGRRKIVCFSTSVQMVEIAANYMRNTGGCGFVATYTGSASVKLRKQMINTFLSEDVPKGVMLLTKAGGVGVTLCPGCETFIIFGSFPWSNEEVRQAAARVHRIGQTQPVEEIMLVPHGSTTKAKVDQIYRDKDERLVALLRDADNSGFDPQHEGAWRLYAGVGRSITALDTDGNHQQVDPHPDEDEHRELRRQYKAAVRAAERRNEAIPACPAELLPRPTEDAATMELPPVSFPVEGFKEDEDEEYNFDDYTMQTFEDAEEQMEVVQADAAGPSDPSAAADFRAAWAMQANSDSDDD